MKEISHRLGAHICINAINAFFDSKAEWTNGKLPQLFLRTFDKWEAEGTPRWVKPTAKSKEF